MALTETVPEIGVYPRHGQSKSNYTVIRTTESEPYRHSNETNKEYL